MRSQLDHLIEMAERPNISIKVIAFSVGAHPALESNFTILEFAGQAPTIVHAEGLAGQLYLERQHEVERYQLAVERLRDLALNPVDSIRFIEEIRDTYVNE